VRKGLRPFDAVYRLGGEEFLILLPGMASTDAVALAERLRHAVGELRPNGVGITMSFGVATSDATGHSGGQLVDAADAALYVAKRDGRNRVSVAAHDEDALGLVA
jgi:diguanylate cyclase (GGDEF)-like protein